MSTHKSYADRREYFREHYRRNRKRITIRKAVKGGYYIPDGSSAVCPISNLRQFCAACGYESPVGRFGRCINHGG